VPGLGESLVILLIFGVILTPLIVVFAVLRRNRNRRLPPDDRPRS